MRVLLVEPLKHPRVVEIPDTLEKMYRLLECRTITVTYPWETDYVGLVTDDEGMLSGKMPNRYIKELRQPIMGNFFICGLSADNFADLPEDLVKKYRKMFWVPELILGGPDGVAVLPVDDGTKPEET